MTDSCPPFHKISPSSYIFQLTPKTCKTRIVLSLPETTEKFKIIKNPFFQLPSLTKTVYVTLCMLLGKQKHCYAKD